MTNNLHFIVLDYTLKGGIERYVANMCDILSGEVQKIYIHSLHRSNQNPFYQTPSNVEINYVTNLVFGKYYKFSTLWACWKLSRVVKLSSADHIVISTSPIIVIFLTFVRRSILKYIIATEHSSYEAHGKFIRALRIYSYKKIYRVVTQTVNGVENFSRKKIICTKIPNPVTIFNDKRQWRENFKYDDYIFNCLTVGRFEDVKQLDHFIEAAKIVYIKHPNIRYNIVGSGPKEFHLKKLIEDTGISKVLKILPSTPRVNELYGAADVYIITSSSEAFPMTALEALSYGVPLISYDKLIGPREIISNGVNGYLVNQNEPKAIAQKIIDLYNNKLMYKEMRRNALLSSQKYSPGEILKLWSKLI